VKRIIQKKHIILCRQVGKHDIFTKYFLQFLFNNVKTVQVKLPKYLVIIM
jgi:hypothetical protein